MASHSTLIQGKGFTLMEVLIVVGLLAMILSLGLILSMDFYKTYAFNYEKDLIVGFLQQARSRSMANINQLTHGVRYDIDEKEYILFEGPSEQVFEANNSIEIDWDEEVVFDQLEGSCTCPFGDITINLKGLGKESNIFISEEGSIDYE